MSSIGNPSMYVRKLSTALVAALFALVALATTTVLAQVDPITVTKPDTIEMLRGGSATFQIQVTATTAVKNVVLQDAFCTTPTLALVNGDTNTNGILDPGETWLYNCTLNGVQTDFTNTATVTGVRNDNNQPVGDSDTGLVKVFNPGVHLTKEVVTASPILQNTNVTFNIFVENTGSAGVLVADINLTDLQCSVGPTRVAGPAGGDLDNDNILDPDTNILDGALDGERWQYTCQVNNVINDFTNVASVTVKDTNNQTFSHSASASVTVLNPGLAITKAPHAATVTAGQPLTWTIKIYNTGSVDMQNVTVTETDPDCTLTPAAPPYPGDIDNDSILDRNEVWTLQCVIASVSASPSPRSNTATVDATGVQGGQSYSDSATASVNVIVPGIQIEKEPLVQVIAKGSNAVFTLKVSNTGQGELSNVTVEDLLCTSGPTFTGGDTDNDGKLDPDPVAGAPYTGEVWSYSCTIANVQNDLINIATARAKDAAGNNVAPAIVTSAIDVINPGINIDKTPNTQVIAKGGTANFGISVSIGTGDTALTNVVVTDPQCSANPLVRTGGDDGDNVLELGEAWTYACSIANVQADFTNEAFVAAKDPLNNPLSGSDKAEVDVLTPGLSVEKSPPFQVVQLGNSAPFTIEVKNTGQADLTPAPGVGDPFCTPVYVRGDTNTNGILDGDDPTVAGNDSETWVYSCVTGPVAVALLGDFINVATATFNDGPNVVTDSDRATVDVINPGIDLEKTASPSTVIQGQPVKFTFIVTNQGNQDLSNVVLTDALCDAAPVRKSGDTDNDNRLDTTETWVYECTVSNTASSFTNNASVTAVNPNNITLSDTDQASVIVLNAQLSVNKSTLTPIVPQGFNVDFAIQASNTGSQNLVNVTITDNMTCQGGPGGAPTFTGGDVNFNNILNPGETWTWSCTVANAQSDYTNTATVTAKEQSTNQMVTRSDPESVTVIRPGINLEKNPPVQSVLAGQSVNFELLVANSGNTNLTNVQVTDVQCNVGPTRTSGDTDNDNVLDAGEIWRYSCTVNNAMQNFTNSAAVTASSGGQAVADTDTADVIVLSTSIRIDKTPDQQTIPSGGTANFTINVSNPGTAPLSSVVVNDPLCSASPLVRTGGDTDNDNILDPGEIWIYSCSVAGATQDFVNTASVTASTGAGTVSASDTANVTVQNGGGTPGNGKLNLEKSPATQTVIKGSTATFQVTLNNGTAEDLTNIVLSDPKCTTLTRLSDAPGDNNNVLNKGETWRWTCTIVNVQKSVTNTAKVTATRPNGKKLKDTAKAKVKVVKSNQIRIETSISDATVNPGASLPMRITVTNIGAGNLRDLQVSHDACTDAPVYVSGDHNGNSVLNRGESWVYTCTIANIQGEISGLATASALDDSNIVQEADALTDVELFNAEEDEEAAKEAAFEIFIPLVSQ